MKNSFKDILRQLGLTAQLHGVPKIFNTNRISIKIIWIITTLISTVSCISLFLVTIFSFLDHPVITNIDLIRQIPMFFPTVSICSFKNDSLKLLICKFNNKDCLNDIITFYDDWNPANCLQFNSKGSYYSTRSGWVNGLTMIFFTNKTDDEKDFFVLIHNKSSVMPGKEEHAFAEFSKKTLISIKKTVHSKLTLPYNDCINDLNSYRKFNSTFYLKAIQSGFLYSQTDCLDYAVYSELNCSNSYSKFISDCKSKSISMKFMNSYFYKYYENESYKNYLELCPVECNKISFSQNVNSGEVSFDIDNDDYQNLTSDPKMMSIFPNGNKSTNNELRAYTTLIRVYYNELIYSQITQQPKIQTWDFISSIGGIFGLFLGISFLSFIDIIQFFIELIIFLASTENTILNK